MKIESKVLIEDLEERTIKILDQATQWNLLKIETLNWKENDKSWSMLECLEHLNRYANFYIPEMRNRISSSSSTFNPSFKSGLLGNYFAESMLPKLTLRRYLHSKL